jgi:hypothetical protein
VPSRGVVVGDDEPVLEGHLACGGRPGAGVEERVDVRQPVVEALEHRVDLGPHARREHDGLREVGAVAERGEGLRDVVVTDGEPLQQLQRSVSLVQPYDDDRHPQPPPDSRRLTLRAHIR